MAVKEISIKVGERIKYYRTMKKLSQEALALAAEMNQAYLGEIERGIKCPTIDTLNKIVTALDLSFTELLDFDRRTDSGNAEEIERITIAVRNLSKKDAGIIANVVEEITKIKD